MYILIPEFKGFNEWGGATAGQVSIFTGPISGDESAVFGLPFRLSVGALLFAVLLLLSAISFSGFLEEAEERGTVDEVSKLIAAAEQLSLRGAGSEITLELRIPNGVTVVFGALPGREGNWPADANNYYVRAGGRDSFYSVSARFSDSSLEGPVFIGPGRHRLTLKTSIVSGTGTLFVLVCDSENEENENQSEGLQEAGRDTGEEINGDVNEDMNEEVEAGV